MNYHEWEGRSSRKKNKGGSRPSRLVPWRLPTAEGRLGGRVAEDALLKEGTKEEGRRRRAIAHKAQVVVERVSGMEKPGVKTSGG